MKLEPLDWVVIGAFTVSVVVLATQWFGDRSPATPDSE